MKHGKLIIICGLPGSGKTTLAKKIQEQTQAVRFCPDEWMEVLSINLYDENSREKIETLQWEIAQNIMAQGGTTIIEWGTWGRSERDTLRLKARELNASVELHYLYASAEDLYERISRRGMENPPIKKSDVDKWFEVFQVPDSEEMALFDKSYES